MDRGWLHLPYVVWAVICLAVSVLYAVFWPQGRVAVDTAPLRLFLVRWGHSLAWAFLAAMCLMKAPGQPQLSGFGNLVGLLALPAYLGFLTATFVLVLR